MAEQVELRCTNCGIVFMRDASAVREAQKKVRKPFCSHKCNGAYSTKGRVVPLEQRARTASAMWRHYGRSSAFTERLERWREQAKDGDGVSPSAYWRKRFSQKVDTQTMTSIMDVSVRTTRKILRRLDIGCSRCGWKEGTGDIHHIRGRRISDPDNHSNLTYLCPNCHRLVHEKKVHIDSIVTLEQQVGDRWKGCYRPRRPRAVASEGRGDCKSLGSVLAGSDSQAAHEEKAAE